MVASNLPIERSSEKLSVVVVDDDVHAANGLKLFLESLGHTCRVAYDGQGALSLLSRARTDVVISDSRMPGIDGLTLCRAIRERDDAYVYFMLVTALDDKGHLVDAMRSGVDDYVTKPVDIDALYARLLCAERVVRLHRALEAKNRRLRRDSERNFHVARVDPLTGARNRRALTEDLRALRTESQRYPGSCAVAMCDLDRFKEYNDLLGHLAGDDALRRVVKIIEGELRSGDGVYRFGGEEFVVLLPHQDLTRARSAMERLRRAVETAAAGPGGRKLTISVGVAELRPDDEDDDACLRRADAALYRAKLAGRNRVAL